MAETVRILTPSNYDKWILDLELLVETECDIGLHMFRRDNQKWDMIQGAIRASIPDILQELVNFQADETLSDLLKVIKKEFDEYEYSRNIFYAWYQNTKMKLWNVSVYAVTWLLSTMGTILPNGINRIYKFFISNRVRQPMT